jgi:hypothetical protein
LGSRPVHISDTQCLGWRGRQKREVVRVGVRVGKVRRLSPAGMGPGTLNRKTSGSVEVEAQRNKAKGRRK